MDRAAVRDRLIDLHASTLGGMLEAICDALPDGHPQGVELRGVIEGGMPEGDAELEAVIRQLGGEPNADLRRKRWDRGYEVVEQLRREEAAG